MVKPQRGSLAAVMWRRAKEIIGNALWGIFMGAADVVPGVSGGTVALLLGIYARLIDTVRAAVSVLGALLRCRWSEAWDQLRHLDWWFGVPLGLGIVGAIGALASIIDDLLANQPEAMAGLFFGLVAASVVVAWKMLEKPSVGLVFVALAVGGLFFWLLGLQSGPVDNPTVLVLFGSGIVAACAMLLPGISGAFILLMLGVYPAAIAAVDDWVWADLGALAVGATVGLTLFSNLIGKVMLGWPNLTLATMVGLLMGSLRVLWPWPNGVGVMSRHAEEVIHGTGLDWPSAADLWLPTLLAIGAAYVVLTLSQRTSMK